ncbi:unnamed protein product [Chrysoparadoxa australica]
MHRAWLILSLLAVRSCRGFQPAGLRVRGRNVRSAPSTALNGIPKLFRWLVDQYPAVTTTEGFGQTTTPIDNFYLDMNGIIHSCTHGNADTFVELNEKEMYRRMFIYTDRLYKLTRPRRLLYLAVDGVAPRAKMNQQRSRRFRSSKEAEQQLAEMVAKNGSLPEGTRFDSNCITPGTDFMYNLAYAFRSWIEFKLENDPFWKENGARVVFSGPDVPGEGEHKVMDYIREARETEEDWHPELRHCLYGLDADLIMLSLVTHEKNFCLLREKMSVRHSRRRKPKDPINYTRNDFELLEVSMLREMLRLQFRSHANDPTLPFKFSLERVIDDFVFMCSFVGNDFLPNMPHLDIADGALNHLISVYKDLLPMMGGYLTNKAQIHRGRLELLIHEVSRREPLYFRSRGIEEGEEAFKDPELYKDHYYAVRGWLSCWPVLLRAYLALSTSQEGDGEGNGLFRLAHVPLTYTNAVPSQDKLGIAPGDVDAKREVVKHYLEALYWVLQYYHDGVDMGSWSWYYPHLYAPLASDLKDLAPLEISFPEGRPFPALMQLLSVLPCQSSQLLPGPYRQLMEEDDSPLLKFYPKDFDCDPNGKRNAWESVVKIPFIDEEELLDGLSHIDHCVDLKPDEQTRNAAGKVLEWRP